MAEFSQRIQALTAPLQAITVGGLGSGRMAAIDNSGSGRMTADVPAQPSASSSLPAHQPQVGLRINRQLRVTRAAVRPRQDQVVVQVVMMVVVLVRPFRLVEISNHPFHQ